MRARWVAVLVVAGWLVGGAAAAAPVSQEENHPQVFVTGRTSVVVTRSDLKLGDLAEVRSARAQDDDIVIGLQKIFVAKAPAPGQHSELSAEMILERMKSSGVDLRQIGYTLPRTVSVQRAGRVLTSGEVSESIRASLENSEREISLRRLDYRENVYVPPGAVTLKVKTLDNNDPGRMEFALSAAAENGETISFRVGAEVDEWREVPVAARPIGKGTVIGENDLKLARMSLRLVPNDAELEQHSLVGLETNRSIGFGEVFQKNKLLIPAVITAGSRVTLRYRTALLEASATGTALESGIGGQSIKVKNDSSRKIVTGTVLEPGLVGVGQ